MTQGQKEVPFERLDARLAESANGAERWGTKSEDSLTDLERFLGRPLPPDMKEFAIRYGNLNLPPAQIALLGTGSGITAAEALTRDVKKSWSSMPDGSIAFGEIYSELFVLHSDDSVGVHDLDFSPAAPPKRRNFPGFSAFLSWLLDLTKGLG